MFQNILLHYIDSCSMLQKVITAIIIEQWALEFEVADASASALVTLSGLANELSNRALTWLQSDPPPAYHEMAMTLAHIHND